MDAVDDASAQNSERKEENAVTGIEENEWDRLLRVRLGALLVLAPIIISLHFMCTVTVGWDVMILPFNFSKLFNRLMKNTFDREGTLATSKGTSN